MTYTWYIVRYKAGDLGRFGAHTLDPSVPEDTEVVATVVTERRDQVTVDIGIRIALLEFKAIMGEVPELQTACPGCNGILVITWDDGHQVMHSSEPCILEPLPEDGEAE